MTFETGIRPTRMPRCRLRRSAPHRAWLRRREGGFAPCSLVTSRTLARVCSVADYSAQIDSERPRVRQLQIPLLRKTAHSVPKR